MPAPMLLWSSSRALLVMPPGETPAAFEAGFSEGPLSDPAALCGSDGRLVGCWQMEENGGTTLVDGSSHANNGTFTGTPSWVNGRTGDYALYLTGTQYATVPANTTLDLTTGLTVSAWVRPNLSSTYMYVLTKNVNTGGTAVNGYDLSLTSGHLVRIRFNNSAVLNSTTNYPHDGVTWMHIAATWDGTTVRLYLNGTQEANTLAFSGPIQTNSLPLAIGSQNTTDPRPFYGNLDDVRLYKQALSASEVLALASIPPTRYTISGNAGAAGVTLSYTDGTAKTATANGAGDYSFSIPTGWSGTVTPSLAGYSFTPSSRTYTNVRSNQAGQDYTALAHYTISGNAGVASAVLYYTDTTLKTATADGAGNYTITIPSGWSGDVVPALLGYTFDPASRTYAGVSGDLPDENYTATAGARTYYVDNTNVSCSDTGPGTSPLLPFCTMAKGASVATAGMTVHVLHGIYAETVYPNGGAAGSPVTFHADPGVTVTGAVPGFGSAFAISTASYVVIDGFSIDNTPYKGIFVNASDHITISNNHVSHAGATSVTHPYEQGIYLRDATYSTITGNMTDHNTCIGIRLVGGDHNTISNNVSFSNYSVVETDAAGIELTGSSYNTVIHNITYSNEDSGINVYLWIPAGGDPPVPSTHNLVIGNVSYENGDHGIDNNNSPYNTIIGNTVQGNGTAGINFEGEAGTGSHHATVMNNISVANGFTPPTGSFGGNLRVDSESVDGTLLDYNLYDRESATVQIIWNNDDYLSLAELQAAVPAQEVHGLESDPLLVGPVASVLRQDGVPYVGMGIEGDYHLQSGSPAIDSANADAPGETELDIEGNARVDDPPTVNSGAGIRTYDDRGAYEYQPIAYLLSVAKSGTGTGSVTSDPAGIDCGPTCSAYFARSSVVTLTAVPDHSSEFDGWSGEGCSGTGSCQVTMSAARSVTATFTLKHVITTTIVTSDSPGATSTYGDSVVFTAKVVPDVNTGMVEFIEGGTCSEPGVMLQAATAVNGQGEVTFAVSTLTSPGHNITACYLGMPGFEPSSGSLYQTVLPATPICSVTGYNVVYDALQHTATGSCTGVFNETVSGDLDLTGTSHEAPGTYYDAWSFTSTDACYTNTSGNVTDTITTGSITGSVRYAIVDKEVPAVSLTGTSPGYPTSVGTSDLNGTYYMTNFGAGAYTVTPTRVRQACGVFNGIAANDAALVSRYVVGLEPGFTADQIAAAHVAGLPKVSSFDAAMIARSVVFNCAAPNRAGMWQFNPVSRSYSSVLQDITGQNYSAVLIGDVNGDWMPGGARRPLMAEGPGLGTPVVSLPAVEAGTGSQVTLPVSFANLQNAEVGSYQFDLRYDPGIVAPDQVSIAGTISEGLSVVSNIPEDGLLKVAVYGALPVHGDGEYLNIRFIVIGESGSSSPISVEAFRFNDGSVPVWSKAGVINVSGADHIIRGLVLTQSGRPIAGVRVVLASSTGALRVSTTDAEGRFLAASLTAGETYSITVRTRRYKFLPVTVAVVENVTDVVMAAISPDAEAGDE